MAITQKKQVFKNLKKNVLDNHMRNVMPKFQSCRLNGVATVEKTYIHIHIDNPRIIWMRDLKSLLYP